MRTNLRIGEILTEKGYVTEEQMSQALVYQKEHRDKRVGQILMELGFVTEKQVLEALADRLHLQIVNVAELQVDLKAVGIFKAGRLLSLSTDSSLETLTLFLLLLFTEFLSYITTLK